MKSYRIAAVTIVACMWVMPLTAQQPTGSQPSPPPTGTQAPSKPMAGQHGKMTMDCQSMMAAHAKAMEQMKAMDAKLDTLVQSMNTATGPAKVDAVAAVVTELVSQRTTMRESMAHLQGGMMQHMMEHMQAGGPKGMMDCPMMKEMGGQMK
jgi:hypothetical protein